MVYFLVAWAALLAVSLPIGLAALCWARADEVFDRPVDRAFLGVWIGLLALGSALLAASLVLALSPLVGAAIGGAAALAALSWSPVRRALVELGALIDKRLLLALLTLAVGMGLLTAQPVAWFDTGAYHASEVRWLSEFGAVKGVALVHHSLGFGSSWLALAAPLNPGALRDHGIAVMGGAAFFLLTLQAVVLLWRVLRGAGRTPDWLFLAGAAVLVPGLAILQRVNVSASPDPAVSIVVLLAGWAVLTIAISRSGPDKQPPSFSPGPTAVPLILAAGATAVKPQAGVLMAVVALFYVLAGAGRPRRILWAGLIGLAFIGPWVAYELVATGCPAYPFPACTDASWSVGSDAARQEAEAVQSFARWRVEPAPGSGLGWVDSWLTDDLSVSLGALALVSLFALAGGLITAARKPAQSTFAVAASWIAVAGATGLFAVLLRAEEIMMVTVALLSVIPLARPAPGTGWLLAIGLGGIVLALYAGPDPRFAYGYIALLFARLVVFQGPAIWARLCQRIPGPVPGPRVGLAGLLVVAAVAAAIGPFLRPTTPASEAPGLLVAEEPIVSVGIDRSNGIDYRVPTASAVPGSAAVPGQPNALCWASELPCTLAHELDPMVGLRDPNRGIAGGFRKP